MEKEKKTGFSTLVFFILVPKLRLGTPLRAKLCFAAAGQRSCRDNRVPKQSLGTRLAASVAAHSQNFGTAGPGVAFTGVFASFFSSVSASFQRSPPPSLNVGSLVAEDGSSVNARMRVRRAFLRQA